MLDKLKTVFNRYEAINAMLCDSSVLSDIGRVTELQKELKQITPVAEKYREYTNNISEAEENKALLDEGIEDKDFRELVFEEYASAKERAEENLEELKVLLLPRDENDDRNVIIEIRAGAAVGEICGKVEGRRRHGGAYFFQVSLSVTVRLKTGLPSAESGSVAK